jgi:hypothetical protein
MAKYVNVPANGLQRAHRYIHLLPRVHRAPVQPLQVTCAGSVVT